MKQEVLNVIRFLDSQKIFVAQEIQTGEKKIGRIEKRKGVLPQNSFRYRLSSKREAKIRSKISHEEKRIREVRLAEIALMKGENGPALKILEEISAEIIPIVNFNQDGFGGEFNTAYLNPHFELIRKMEQGLINA